ncbi:tryptophan--tRNA ligase [Roseivirga pacifica]|uniref:tryptophan--tRNA ligase n=1 Tax=Roseivirga pacifica TaxID=1267423 RepID=UPI0020955335|nr:tryptophan--tRNA ligase [Roseivirga pacifica]MCO6358158.1 tryptophan--tRNA ligase [Roseivirga pacifica]MCO6366596.1 tryptophan--tRNA ligase [Roseivirga pacifica]MCO6371081.1 tryptophan--tRNA ligase [Roseivirga pacifica]MCO6373889.1 tryptophan--tRNA ligase [Roseivirga pacifica]MCO6380870.1 tryptophan--tRNA ligase [Roseivirga pacifica]
MARILTGIQSSGKPHLGNILGAIKPAIELSKNEANDSFFFIADLHSLTTIKDAQQRIENTNAVAAAWLAFGFDTEKNTFYRQSRVPATCELTWYLSCFTPYPMLANAHSFKDKSDRLSDVNAGLFTYPVLMACDILLYDANVVPVGKDQKQHLEITRDLASAFNHQYGEIFVLPEAKIDEHIMTIPGTDGQKMSKSYGNTIDIFQPDKQLRKNIMKIVSDSTPLEEPKDPDTDNTFAIYSLLASDEQTAEMRKNYEAGGYGYGHAKQALYELIIEKFAEERALYNHYMENPQLLEEKLAIGEAKAAEVSNQVLERVKKAIGYC